MEADSPFEGLKLAGDAPLPPCGPDDVRLRATHWVGAPLMPWIEGLLGWVRAIPGPQRRGTGGTQFRGG
jgi:hypothetical protein